jgi:polyisoprenoid-binding protein YceI
MMIKKVFVPFLLACLFLVFTSSINWKINDTSKVAFTISGLFGMGVDGTLNYQKSQISFDPQNLQDAKMDVTIDVSSIKTSSSKRDENLRSNDFFDVAKYPIISFESSQVKKIDGGKYEVEGKLKMKNTIKNIKIPFTFEQIDKSKAMLMGEFTLNRLEYEVGKSSMSIGDIVKIKLKTEIINLN